MAITQIKVDGEVVDISTLPVKYRVKGSGKHRILYYTNGNSIKEGTFTGCDLDDVVVKSKVTSVEENAFDSTKLKSIYAENSSVINLPTEKAVTPKSSEYNSEVKVGYVLYERSDGTTYAAEYTESNTDTALGVCVLPKGLFSNDKPSFVALHDVMYNESGNVVNLGSNTNDAPLFAPRINGLAPGFGGDNVTMYPNVPYIGMMYKSGLKETKVMYDNYDDIPGLVTSGRHTYTNDYNFDFLETVMGVKDNSNDHSLLELGLCPTDTTSMYNWQVPGTRIIEYPYDRTTRYGLTSIDPVESIDTTGSTIVHNGWFFSKSYFLPSPYKQVDASDDVVVNPLFMSGALDNTAFDYSNGKSHTYIYVRNSTTKPETKDALNDGVVTSNSITWFPAPMAAYEYAPGTGNTQHEWYLGCATEWMCLFARITKINEVIDALGGDKLEVNYNTSGGCYWTSQLANRSLIITAFTRNGELCGVTLCEPRMRTRPFISI